MMNSEMKRVVERVKTAQVRFQGLLKNQDWVDEARKYAEKQAREVRKLLTSDAGKVKVFIERERKELERFQRQIPGEVKKLSKFVKGQRKELERLLAHLRKAGKPTAHKPARKTSARRASRKTTASS